MSEAVTIPSLMMVALMVSEESLARDRQTDRHTQTHTRGLVKIKMFKIAYYFENKTK